MRSPAKTRVGFTFVEESTDWQGGLNYFRALFLALQSLPDSALQPVAFFRGGADTAAYGFSSNVKIVTDSTFNGRSIKRVLTRLSMRLGGIQSIVARVALRHGVHILSHGVLSGTDRLPSVAWIPDFQHVHLPHFFPAEELQARDHYYRELVERSDLVIVSSESARADLQQFAPGHAAKARVLRFAAVRPDVGPTATIDLTTIYGLDVPYFYLPNQTWAHKNHLTAVHALASLCAEHPDVKIVCSGSLADYRNPRHLEELRATIAGLGLTDRFLLLGLIPYEHIAQLMLGSVAVINPSLFEGWSTTVEEAKALGVPLILSNIPVHLEQCEQGEATFFAAKDPAALAERMRDKLGAWSGAVTRDPSAALATHAMRVTEFGLSYERIIAELRSPALQARAPD